MTPKAKKKTPNPRCPHCANNRYRTLKKNGEGVRVTRCCEQPVVTVNGTWHIELEAVPEWRVLKLFEQYQRKRIPGYTIEYGDPSYQGNLRAAVTLWQRCDRSADLVDCVLDVCFNHEGHRWRDYPALYAVLNNKLWGSVIALGKIALAKSEKKAKAESRISAGQFDLGAQIPALG